MVNKFSNSNSNSNSNNDNNNNNEREKQIIVERSEELGFEGRPP